MYDSDLDMFDILKLASTKVCKSPSHRSYLSTANLSTLRPTMMAPALKRLSMKGLFLAQKLPAFFEVLTVNILYFYINLHINVNELISSPFEFPRTGSAIIVEKVISSARIRNQRKQRARTVGGKASRAAR